MEISKVPDDLIISLVEGEQDEIADYLADTKLVTDYEIEEGFNITNDRIAIVKAKDKTAKKYERTNTLCVQAVPKEFMKVFDENDKPLQLKQGEIAFPKIEANKNHLAVGDKVMNALEFVDSMTGGITDTIQILMRHR